MKDESTHIHFLVIAYDHLDKDGTYERGADIDLLGCTDEDDAIEKTKQMINRKEYKVVKILTHHDDHGN